MSQETQTQSLPPRIQKLSEEVINRIAAGEVIQRPSNALKELLENSLDAGSTQIKLYLRDGGITELRIEDNGSGILCDDFPLLCERFATSKLDKFEDLYSIATYGFRGEALASISFCAQLCITSKTKDEQCAYRAHFINGKMFDPDNPEMDHKDIKPSVVAGMPGTQIIVKKLFYNMPIRQKALKARLSQEYNTCLKVVSCYAIHNTHCSFAVQKLTNVGSNSLDLNVRTNANKKNKDVIKNIYGGDIGQYLIEIHKDHGKIKGLKIDGTISNCDFAMNASRSGSNRGRNKSRKRIFNTNNRMELVLFINHRLVESLMIKKCIMSVYEDYLAKNHYPFVYLSIIIPPNFVDVNVHPTKKEVKFLHQEQVMQLIQEAIDEKLKVENNQRTFHAHSLQHFMTQSNITNVVSITSKKKQQMMKKKKEQERELKNNQKNIKIKHPRRECKIIEDIKVIKDESTEIQREKLVASLSASVDEINENINRELQQREKEILDLNEPDQNNEESDNEDDDMNDKSSSPNSPLRRRGKVNRPHISNVSRKSLEIDDHDKSNDNDKDNNQNGVALINADDDHDEVLSQFNFSPSPQSKRNNNNHNNRRTSLRQSTMNRKRNYSNLIDTDEDDEDIRDLSINVNNLQPNIVTLNLNEKKKKKKPKPKTRVRVDSQQSNLDYYWKGNNSAALNTSNKRRKLSPLNLRNVDSNRNIKKEQKELESEDDDIDTTHDANRRPLRGDVITYCTKKQTQTRVTPQPECVKGLIAMIDRNGDANFKKIFEENVYVGCVDSTDPTSKHNQNNRNEFVENTFQRVLFQYDTKLFLCNIHRISRIYFFELCVSNIGKFRGIYKLVPNPRLKTEPNNNHNNKNQKAGIPTIYDLILLALDLDECHYDEKLAGPKHEVAKSVTNTLCHPAIAKILLDYFSIEIDIENKVIKSIPCLIDGYIPGLLYLPVFLFRLVTEIAWFQDEDDEIDVNDKHLFKQISMEIARFYQIRPPQFYFKMDENKRSPSKRFGGYNRDRERTTNKHNLGWILQHVIFRSFNKKCTKYSFHPPKFLRNDGSIVQIACTKQLYKVFERC